MDCGEACGLWRGMWTVEMGEMYRYTDWIGAPRMEERNQRLVMRGEKKAMSHFRIKTNRSHIKNKY